MLAESLYLALIKRGISLSITPKEIESQAAGHSAIACFIQQQTPAEPLAQVIAEQLMIPYFDLDHIADETINLEVIPEHWIRDKQCLPILVTPDFIQVATANPCNAELFHEIQVKTGRALQIKIVAYDKLAKRIAKLFRVQAQEDLVDDAPIVRYVEKLILDAIYKHASDIHFEPFLEHLRIRFRIDGILYQVATLSPQFSPRLIAHLKVLANLDITEKRLPQDGRLQITLPTQPQVDCRLSVCPTVHGEKLVLRLLNAIPTHFNLETLGFMSQQLTLFTRALHKPQGMIIVTGPTGSGKTVTLYTALRKLNQIEVNISSAEDPVEINLPGINQIAVNPKIGLHFSTVLRAFLRQDPDIIMVGEMRDAETADIAIQAAQTGHLVLTTLHTNSAAETLTRLMNMGIPSYQIAASVSLIIAQRLVRCLCDACKQQTKSPQHPEQKIFTAVGCTKCQNGYRGRTAIYEVMPITPRLVQAILHQSNAVTLERQAKKEGMQTLAEHAKTILLKGITSIDEIARVIH